VKFRYPLWEYCRQANVNPSFLHLSCDDIDEFAEEIPALSVEPIQLSRGHLHIDLLSLDFGDVVVSEMNCNQQVADRIYIDPSWLLIVFQRTLERWNSCEVPPNSLTLIRPDSDYRTLVPRGFRCSEVAIRVDLAEDIGLGRWLRLSKLPTVISPPRHTMRIAMRWLTNLLNKSESSGLLDFDPDGDAGRDRCLEFLCWLKEAVEPSEGGVNAFCPPRNLKRFDLVDAALQIIDDTPIDSQPSVTDLARILCVSRRSLLNAFVDVLGTPPSRYLLARKLHFARQGLKSGASHTVTDAAFSCGFEHLSRFSAHYAILFGELPSITLRRPDRLSGALAAG
jgi:AraC-like DNA-binding protein